MTDESTAALEAEIDAGTTVLPDEPLDTGDTAGDPAAEQDEKPTEQTGEAEQPTDTEEGGDEQPEADEEPEEQPRGKSRFDKRIKELTRRQRDTERENIALRQELDEIRQRQTAPPPPAEAKDDPEPKQEDFEDYHQFTSAHARWAVRQEHAQLRARDEERSRIDRETESRRTEEERARQAADRYTERADAFADTVDDFEEVVAASDVNFPTPVLSAIQASEHGPAIAYHLAKNPEQAARIAAMDPVAATLAVGRLEAVVTARPKPKQVPKAGPPEPKLGGGSQARVTPDKMSMDEYAAYRRKQGTAQT